MADEKKGLGKILCLDLNNGMFLEPRVEQAVLIIGIKLNRQLGEWLVKILYEQDFFHQCRFSNHFKPNSLKTFLWKYHEWLLL